MLARLDQDLAPFRASVDREGALLRLGGPRESGDLAERVPAVVGEMGYWAESLAVDEAPAVPRWFGSAEVDELSREEAEVLAARWADGLAQEGVIERPERVVPPLADTLFEAFRDSARTGRVERPTIDEATLRSVLDEAEARAVREWVERTLVHLRDQE